MRNTDKRNESPVTSARRAKRKYAVIFLIAILWLALALIVASRWRKFGTVLFYGDVRGNEDFFQLIEETTKEGTPPPSAEYFRQPVGGETETYLTIHGVKHPDAGVKKHTISIGKGDRAEVGLTRLRDGYRSPRWEYTFSVFENRNGKRRKLIEETQEFPESQFAFYRITDQLGGDEDGETELEYVLRPKGFRAWAGTAVAKALGGPPYHRDFLFFTPTVLRRREPDELNVVLISFDTLRPDRLGCYGYTRRPTSPHIDAFAERSVLFMQAFSSSPWTLPAHYSLMTGLYPSAQMTPLEDVRQYLWNVDRPIAAILRDNGYYTIGITGGRHLTSANGFAFGFDRYMEFHHELTDSTHNIFQNALKWLDENNDTKFFMFLHNYECHSPYTNTRFLEKENVYSLIEARKALYDGGVRSADAYFAELIEKLKSLDLLSKTVIVVLSDHGDDLYDHFTESDRIPREKNLDPRRAMKIDHGHSLYDEVIRILMLFHLPGLEPGNRVLSNQVRIIDVMPTILDYLGIPLDGPLQGTSLLQLMEEGGRTTDPPAVSEFTLYGPERKSVRMDGYKYIYIPDPDQRKDKVTYTDIPQYALFDLRTDPGEKSNIFSENKEVGERYHRILEETLEESHGIRGELRPINRGDSTETPQDVIDALKSIGYLQ